MSITKIEYRKEKPGLRYDSEKKVWIGYRIDLVVGAVRDRTGGFSTRRKAQEYIDKLKEDHKFNKKGLKNSAALVPRVSELFERRLDLIRTKRERVRANRIFKHFESLLDFDLLVTDIRPAHFRHYINSRENVKGETINREITILSTAFKRAEEMFPDALQDFDIKVVRPRFKRTPRHRVVTESEKAKILEYLHRPHGDETAAVYIARLRIGWMFELSWYLGLRFAETAKLEASDFNQENKSLRVVRWKTGTISLIEYLPEVVCELLKKAIEASSMKYIFTHSGTRPTMFYPILREAVESAGLKYGRNEQDGITFHSNRHSFTTRLIQVTDIATARAFTGHSNAEMVDYYSHASVDSRRAAMEKLYGKPTEDLRQIYDNIVSGELDFDDFVEAVRKL